MSERGPWRLNAKRLALTPDVRRAVVSELEKRKSQVFREGPCQDRFLEAIEIALEITRRRSGIGPNRDAPRLRRIKKHLEGLEKELSKLTPWQRAEFDLAAEHASRMWLRILLKEAAEAAVLETTEDACTGEAKENETYINAEDFSNVIADRVPSGPQTMLGRVGIDPVDAGTEKWRPKWDSDFLLDHFQWECHILTVAASQVITSYADMPPQHKYVGPPPAVIHLIKLLGYAWKRAFGQEPSDKLDGAFWKVVDTLITQLQILDPGKHVGAKSLKRALNF